MVSISFENLGNQENASAGEGGAPPIGSTSGIFLCLCEDGLNLCRFTRRISIRHGSGESEYNEEWVRESKRKIDFDDKPPMFEEKQEIEGKNDDVDTTLSLALPGTKRKDDPCNKNIVPTSQPLASNEPNPSLIMPQPNEKQPRMICMGCNHCHIRFATVPSADSKCPQCHRNGFLLDPLISPRRNKRARKN